MALTCRRATDSSFLCSAFLALYMWKVAWILVAALRMILNFFRILYLRLKSDKRVHALGLGERGGGAFGVPSLLDGHSLGEQAGSSLIFEFSILRHTWQARENNVK